MALTVAAMRLLAEKGLSLADVISVAEANETAPQPSRNANAVRQARYRQRNKMRDAGVTGDASSNALEAVTHNVIDITAPSPSRPSPPDPPNPPIPARRDIPERAMLGLDLVEKGSPQKKYLISPNWTPSPEERHYAKAEGMTEEDVDREAASFRDFFIDKQERRPGWTRSWQRWVRTWAERRPQRRAGPGATSGFSDPTSARNHGRTAAMFAGAALAARGGSSGNG